MQASGNVALTLRWLRAIWHWLGDAQLVWIALIAVILVPQFSVVVFGIGRPSILDHARSWFQRLPAFHPKGVVGVATAVGHAHATAKGYQWRNTPQNPTIDDRLDVVERNLEALRSRVDVSERDLDQEVRERQLSVKAESDTRVEADRQIRELLEGAAAGGLHLSIVGVVWLAIGVVIATFPTEIASHL